ncbi:hypothetical protein I7I51_03923 [Histoplasma capsulatum]|uniref:Uncharacterized protein n=1 Tax=Ajellomyces capsulatus TaxID=5037 RepID=A0A8A1M5H4_AJECA|nr:hypothetical protein I7I51_03923 [Histoplasma capsulatum]
MSLAKRTKQRRGERQRLCNNLTDIFLTIGAEVYLLGTLAAPMSILSTETSRELVPKLRLWWKSAPRPNALSLTAAELCSTYSIAALVSSCRKRKISRIANISAKALSPDANITGTSNAEIHPSGQVLNLTLSSLLSFLQQYQANDNKMYQDDTARNEPNGTDRGRKPFLSQPPNGSQ